MASHKRRVERKLKKDVKRKVQASRAKQHSNAQSKPQSKESLEQMMKLVALMKGNGVNTDQATLLKLREEKAKADAELARKNRESAVSIEQSKLKTKGLTKEDVDLENKFVQLQTDKKNLEEEIKQAMVKGKMDKVKPLVEKLEKENGVLKSRLNTVNDLNENSADELIQFKAFVDKLDHLLNNLKEKVVKPIDEGQGKLDMKTFLNEANYTDVKDAYQGIVVGLMQKNDELDDKLNDYEHDRQEALELKKKSRKLMDEIDAKEARKYMLEHVVEGYDERGAPIFKQEHVLDDNGNQVLDDLNKPKTKDVKRDIHKELKDAMLSNKNLEIKNNALNTNIKHREDIINKVDKLNLEKDILTAENNALGEVVVEDKTAEMGRLNKEIKDLQDLINDKRQQGLDAKAYERKLAEKERERKELEAENNAMGAAPVVRTPVINKYAQAKVESDKTQREIDVKNRDKKLVQDQEDENAKQDFENKKRTQLLRSSNPQINTYKSKAVTNWVMAQKQKELNKVKEENYKSEQELRDAQTEGNAHKLPEIQATMIEIQNQIKEQKINQEKTKAQQALNRERAAARTTLIQRKAEQDMNMAMANDTSITDMTSALTALNEKINRETENAQNDEKYVDSVLGNIKALASEHAEMMEVVNQYLTNKGKAIFETPDHFSMRVHSRMQADALKNIVDALAETYNPEDQFYYFDNMPVDADTWLNRLYEQQNDDDDNDFLK